MDHDMSILNDWFKDNQLFLNLTKTVLVNFWSNDKDTNLTLNGITIPVVQVTKFLGEYLDNRLSWNYHTTNVFNKINVNK